MGIVDNTILQNINTEIKKICKNNNFSYNFKTDDGSFETAIEFWAMGYFHPPKSKSWEEARREQREIKCPDLLDYTHRLIIEYEEEPRPQRGPKITKKGHTEESQKDSHRDFLYRIGGFKILKIWESEYNDNSWKQKLEDWIFEISKN